ncbi:MAG TPA: D-alanyl-D-alanine carboxypeptidase family protein [Hypericibacter adhaerens]|uniref:D-alanyl-D-alanine carboxypeptidase family protein n=1 Tax=Hypericibacter adhaerens TaxID=2602016 RepID=UPI002C8CEAF6|nr:D-alanyl-D-alanine carboxypeptidase family protein [Hypericibacter adhaerens]HWA46464.1 D-alanyl-D-alanine carboxypeptidase family protein [Hypericibacter adhaerens]
MASIVVDAGTGQVLQQVDATRVWHPASLTKLMTVYLAFETLRAGQMTADETLTVSETAAAQPETKLGLRAGKTISVAQAIKAVIVRSANDAAVLLGERIAGSEDAFAAMMTAKAHELGMTRTVFHNATGLPDDGQVTTARDMALLARALMRDFPDQYPIFASTNLQWHGQTLSTYNGLLSAYQGADGLKTGFTCASGYNLVGSALRDGRRLIGVVLGGRSSAERNGEMARLLDAGFHILGAPSFPDVAAMPDGDSQPPPRQLSSAECSTLPSTAIGGGGGGKLPGWAVIFGAFPDQAAARKTVDQARKSLQAVLKHGQPAVIRRQTEGTYRWAALLVGLAQEEAKAACRKIQSSGAYCLALNPDVLNSPTALWR